MAAVQRDTSGRMTEVYYAVRDAMTDVALTAGLIGMAPGSTRSRPSYLPAPAVAATSDPEATAAAMEAGITRMAMTFPGRVS